MSNLPLVWVRDARTGTYISKGRVVEYPSGEWWSWHDWKYDDNGKALLWTRSNNKPDGYWQECPAQLGGVLWIFPS
jgi:hypothetical protein